jgi:hypothetical protein
MDNSIIIGYTLSEDMCKRLYAAGEPFDAEHHMKVYSDDSLYLECLTHARRIGQKYVIDLRNDLRCGIYLLERVKLWDHVPSILELLDEAKRRKMVLSEYTSKRTITLKPEAHRTLWQRLHRMYCRLKCTIWNILYRRVGE